MPPQVRKLEAEARRRAEQEDAEQRSGGQAGAGGSELEARVKALEGERGKASQLEEVTARVATVESLFARGEGASWSLAPEVEAGVVEQAKQAALEALEPRLSALESTVVVAKEGAWAAMARATAVEEAVNGEEGDEEGEENQEGGVGGEPSVGEAKGGGGEGTEGGRRRRRPLGQRLRAVEEEVGRIGDVGSLRQELSHAAATAQGAETRVQKQGQAVQRLRDHLQELMAEVEELKSPTLSAREAAAQKRHPVSTGAEEGDKGGGVAPAALRREVDELRRLVQAATGGGTPAAKKLSRRVEDVEGAQDAATEELRRLQDEVSVKDELSRATGGRRRPLTHVHARRPSFVQADSRAPGERRSAATERGRLPAVGRVG